jgi:NADPH:quinone reductase and related Zn-dependent oxidoreductases
MKAILCKEYGPAETLVIEDVPSPKMGDRGVKIRVKAAGLNFPDTLIIEGKYQLQPPMPFSPGGELAGEVIEVGDKVTRFKPGDRVAALTGFGAFAEEVVAPESNLLPIPDNMPDEKAAGFMMVYGTSYYALKQRANLQPGETLLVLGASGGVGLAAVELGKAMGAKVIAAASSSEKLRIAKDAGADELINYTDEPLKDAVKKLTRGKGVDVIYDPVGGDFTEQALRTMAWNGRHLIIGFAAGDIPKVPANLTLLKGCSVVGVFWGAFTRNEPGSECTEHDGAAADVL